MFDVLLDTVLVKAVIAFVFASAEAVTVVIFPLLLLMLLTAAANPLVKVPTADVLVAMSLTADAKAALLEDLYK